MRGNMFVAYELLGLNHTLYLHEVLFNRCLTNCALGIFEDAVADAEECRRIHPDNSPEIDYILNLLENGQVGIID